MENIIVALNCVVPLFVYMVAGYCSRCANVIPEETYPKINRLNFYLLLSIYLFGNAYKADFVTSFRPRTILFLVAVTLILFLLAFGIFTRGVENRRRSLYVQNAYRSNIGVVGVALMQNLTDDPDGIALMTIVVAVLVTLYNLLAVIVLEMCRGGKVPVKTLIRNVARNPLIVGTALGLVFNFLHIPVPTPILNGLTNLGKAGVVVAMVLLGASMHFDRLSENRRIIILSTLMRLVLIPMFPVGAAILMGFRGNELAVILLTVAAPLATNAFTMSQIYDSDYELAGQIVMVSSALSCLSLFLWILLLKNLMLI